VRIISHSQQQAAAAANDLPKGDIKHKRDADICSLMQRLSVNDWVGTIQDIGATQELDTTRDAKGFLTIAVAKNILVTTWKSDIQDLYDHSLIDAHSPLFQTMSSMKTRQTVRFSGHFFSGSAGDCLEDGGSSFLSGKLQESDLIFQFSSISSSTG
jgi:hypothetical protein